MHSNDIPGSTPSYQKYLEKFRQITIFWQSLGKVLTLIRWTIMIPFIFALFFPVLLTLGFVIPASFLIYGWVSILATDYFNSGDMKVPTFYSTSKDGNEVAYILFVFLVDGVFGGIHCT
jgi:hypothetical protein